MSSTANTAYQAVDQAGILVKLSAYQPELISTIFVGLDTPTSDIDIICCYQSQANFIAEITQSCATFEQFKLKHSPEHVVVEFEFKQYLFEVFACTTPSQQQLGYRHFQIMKRLAVIAGESFTQPVIELKKSGLKTEPAICKVLNIQGDPYTAILQIEQWTDQQFATALSDYLR